MFEPEVFRKQMCCIEKNTCDIFRTFWRPDSGSAHGELCPPCIPSLRPCPAVIRRPGIVPPAGDFPGARGLCLLRYAYELTSYIRSLTIERISMLVPEMVILMVKIM